MGNRFRNVNVDGERYEGSVVVPRSDRKCLGVEQIPGTSLFANTFNAEQLPFYDVSLGYTLWQYSPITAPVSIASVQIYFVGQTNASGSATFQLVKNQGAGLCPSDYLSPNKSSIIQVFERGQYVSNDTRDYWWINYTTTSDWVSGGCLINYSVWIYDGFS